jgi:hypothetical protein
MDFKEPKRILGTLISRINLNTSHHLTGPFRTVFGIFGIFVLSAHTSACDKIRTGTDSMHDVIHYFVRTPQKFGTSVTRLSHLCLSPKIVRRSAELKRRRRQRIGTS